MLTATDVVAPYWQVFEPPTIDKSTTEFEYVEFQQRDANQIDKPDGWWAVHDRNTRYGYVPITT